MEDLLRQREELQNQIRALDELSAAGTEKILQAIKNQRWFFFKNNKYILLDRDTALLWANLNYFPYRKDGNDPYYSSSNSFSEVRELMTQKNSESWGGFDDWKIPTPFELWKMIEDKTFPFQEGRYWEIEDKFCWCVNYDGLFSKNLSLCARANGATASMRNNSGCCVLPCSHALVPEDYEQNILPSNKLYTETEKLQFTLDIFAQNDLIPLFNDAETTQLYRKIFVEKPALIKQLAEVETQLAELQAAQIKLTANFDYRQLLAHYDTAAVDRSAIKYFDAAAGVADELLEALNEYEAAQATTIAECLKIALKLKAKYTDNPNLTPEENSLLAERQKFLAQRLELGTDAPKKKILSVKVQAEKFFARLETINSGENSIRELAALQTEPRPSFELRSRIWRE